MTVAFEHPPAQRFEGEVTSCYQREGRSGMVVRFTQLSANGLQTLVKVIEARSPQA